MEKNDNHLMMFQNIFTLDWKYKKRIIIGLNEPVQLKSVNATTVIPRVLGIPPNTKFVSFLPNVKTQHKY
jgi:hypothetical protein